MRNGDFSIEIVPAGGGRVRETDAGHVLARPGQVYRLRLRNHGPLRCVVDIDVDGHRVTAGGLVLEAYGTTELERPIDAAEDGRFTVVAEGDEAALGPDGGRDDPALGLIVARFRRELPTRDRAPELPPTLYPSAAPAPPRPQPGAPPLPSRFPAAPPEWEPWRNGRVGFTVEALRPVAPPSAPAPAPGDAIERAAGTGLTGHSDQQFVPIHLGELEAEATVLQLRLVIGTEEALAADAARPLGARQAPARPAARP